MNTNRCLSWSELSNDDLYRLLQLRSAVFVVEQACAYQDLDGLDQQALHLLMHDDAHQLIAYARLLPPGTEGGNHCSIGRVVVEPGARDQQLGRQLMLDALAECRRLWPAAEIIISAQTYLTRFYQSLGFVNTGQYYLEDLIPHQKMLFKSEA